MKIVLPFGTVVRLWAWPLLLALTACAQPLVPARPDLRVMTFNVRLLVESDGPDRWEARRDLMAEVLRHERPDLIGTQELWKIQGDDLAAALPDYAWFGQGRRGGDADEHMGVFYRRDRLHVIEAGDFWLSDTPAVPGSITWGHPFPRMVTWALFQDRAGRRFYLYNTHFPYRDGDEDARVRAAQLILQRLGALPADTPVILMGDFNTAPGSPTHAALTATLRDAWDQAPHRDGPAATFHAFTGRADRRIDWILLRGVRADSVRTVTTQRNGRYPSDHFPVVADLRWGG